jgi:hypothetical protein
MRQFARFSVALRLQHYYCSEPAAVERRLVYVQTLMIVELDLERPTCEHHTAGWGV